MRATLMTWMLRPGRWSYLAIGLATALLTVDATAQRRRPVDHLAKTPVQTVWPLPPDEVALMFTAAR
jgi:hypothetical protein